MVEPSKDPILFRCGKLSQSFNNLTSSASSKQNLVNLENLLDSFLLLYDECNNDYVKDNDKHVASFVNKFRNSVAELKGLRVNIGDFEVHKIIGRGHFGEVQVVREKQTGEVHAMKILRKHDTLAQENLAFFEEERDIMAKAQSPWITQLHYAFQDHNNLYLVMEFVPGGDLLSFMDRCDDVLPESAMRFYMAEIALAIDTLHQMGFVHRDIKPDNILIDRLGHVKLADFGSAAKLTTSGKVETKMPVGTPDYLAPEVLTGMTSDKSSTFYGVECDWWSLGIVGYEMLCGSTPFSNDKATVTYNNIMNHKDVFSWPCELDLSSDVKDLILGLLEEVSERFGYHEIRKHSFFSCINWNEIRDSIPPYVPRVTAQDDTSNFDQFEREVHIPNLEDFKTKRMFSGKNLPFVGFTFTHNLNSEKKKDRRVSLDPSVVVSKLEAKLETKRKEVQDLVVRVSSLQESNDKSKNKIEQLQTQLNLQEETINVVKAERDTGEKDLANCVKELTKLKRFLEFERNERLLNEKKALQLISETQNKWKREEESLKIKLESRDADVASYEPRYAELKANEEKYRKMVESMSQKLLEATKQMEEYKSKLSRIIGNKKESVGEMNVMLEKIANEHEEEFNKLRELLDAALRRKKELKEKLLKAESKLRQKDQQINKLEKDTESFNSLKEIEAQLKVELKETLEKYASLENKLQDYEMSSNDFSAREFAFQELQKTVVQEAEHTRQMQEKISSLEEELNSAVVRQFDSLSTVHEEISDRIQCLTQNKTEADNAKLQLENALEIAEEKQREQNQQIAELKAEIVRLEENLKTIESLSTEKSNPDQVDGNVVSTSDAETKESLDSQIDKLETQLTRAREATSSERQRVREVQDELRKLQKEHTDVKLDLRISQREAKKSQTELAELQSAQQAAKTNLTDALSRIEQMKLKEEELLDKLKSAEIQLTIKETQIQTQSEMFEREKSKFEERLGEFENIKKANMLQQCQYEKIQYQNEELLKQKSMLEEQIKLLTQLQQQQQNEEKSVRDELEENIKKCKSLEHNVNLLKSTCIVLEGQLKDFEILVENHEVEAEKLENDKAAMIDEIKAIEEELKKTKKFLDEESKKRESFETEVKNVQNELDLIKAAQKAEAMTLKGELSEHKQAVLQYNDELNDTEQKLIAAERSRKNHQQRVESLETEIVKVKEEAAKLITHVNSLTDSNFKLTIGLQEAIDKCEYANSQIIDLENSLDTTEMSHRVEKMKMEATIAQHIKLINFLQAQNEGAHKKKKTLQEKLFGRTPKSNTRLPDTSYKPIKYETVPAVKSPTPRSRGILSAITQSPGVQENPEDAAGSGGDTGDKKSMRTPTKERMHHKIPHRFQTALNMRATKCATCLDTIHFGRSSSKCQECQMTVHPKCASSVPSTCGLPGGLIQHFRQSLRQKSSTKRSDSVKSESDTMEGWVKLLRKNKLSWEQKFAQLEDGKLNFYEKENINSDALIESIDLCPPNGETVVHSAVSPADLLSTAKSDLAYILKLEISPQTTCWPGRTLYIMAPSFTDKQKWVTLLESVAKQHLLKRKKIRDAKILGVTILHAEGENVIDVNCVFHLDSKHILIGAEEGLFALETGDEKTYRKPRKIKGIDSVFQIDMVDHLRRVIIITSNDRELCEFKLSTLYDSIQAKGDRRLDPEQVDSVSSCHLFGVKQIAGTTYICAATAEMITLCHYDNNIQTFRKLKEFITAEPCSCIHFTRSSILVGADKFFEIDPKHLSVEEFLDASDKSLAYAIYATAQVNSFPVAALQISDDPYEFLICFHEFGIFVDERGRRTRKADMKWTRLPLAFALQAPYLFVTHFNSVEVTEIKAKNDAGKGNRTFLDVSNPRYLGYCPGGGIYLGSLQESSVDVICLKGNLVPIDSADLEETAGEEDEDNETIDTATSDFELSFSSSSGTNAVEQSSDALTLTEYSSDFSHLA